MRLYRWCDIEIAGKRGRRCILGEHEGDEYEAKVEGRVVRVRQIRSRPSPLNVIPLPCAVLYVLISFIGRYRLAARVQSKQASSRMPCAPCCVSHQCFTDMASTQMLQRLSDDLTPPLRSLSTSLKLVFDRLSNFDHSH